MIENNFENLNTENNISQIKEILNLAPDATYKEIYLAFSKKDNEIMNKWKEINYTDQDLVTTQIKNLLNVFEQYPPDELNEGIREIFWLWYHHASQAEFIKNRNKEKAIEYLNKTFYYKNNDNQISQLLLYLYNNDFTGAEEYTKNIVDSVEKQTAIELIEDYKKLNVQ